MQNQALHNPNKYVGSTYCNDTSCYMKAVFEGEVYALTLELADKLYSPFASFPQSKESEQRIVKVYLLLVTIFLA